LAQSFVGWDEIMEVEPWIKQRPQTESEAVAIYGEYAAWFRPLTPSIRLLPPQVTARVPDKESRHE